MEATSVAIFLIVIGIYTYAVYGVIILAKTVRNIRSTDITKSKVSRPGKFTTGE